MAMYAANFTKFNLGFNSCKAVRASNQIRNGACLLLRVNVIEFQNHRVGFSAIDARMRPKKIVCKLSISSDRLRI